MTYEYEPWTIVSLGKQRSNQKRVEQNLALVFEKSVNKFQIFYLSPRQNQKSSNSVTIGRSDLDSGSLSIEFFMDIDKFSILDSDSIGEEIGKIGAHKIEEILRKMSRHIAQKFYNEIHANKQKFVQGKSYIHYAGRVYDAQEIETLVDSCLDFWLTAGRYAKQFEQELCNFLGVKYCILTNSGSSANLLSIAALTSSKLGKRSLQPGDEVITTACAFPTTVNPIIQNKLVPVFLDVDIDTYNIQVEKIEGAISKKTKAIFLAHTLGIPFKVNEVLNMTQKYNLWLVEDNCDSLGSKYNGQYTGTFGHIATYSFYPPHHITMGEGGALTTNDVELKRLIESFRDWGRDCWCDPGCDNTCGKRFTWQLGSLPYGYDHKFIYSHLGYNLKITDMQAAIGVAQIKKLNHFIEARKKNWSLLYQGLAKFDRYFILPKSADKSEPSWFGFPLTVRAEVPFSKNDIVSYLEKNKIATRMLFAGNIVRHPCFHDVKYRIYGDLDNTDSIMNNTFWVGVYPGLSSEMIGYVIETFEKFVKKYQ